jgi:hypothetical protein
MASKWESEKENLEKLISAGVSYEEIGRQYGCTGANIKKAAVRLGIELKARRIVNECETFGKGTIKVPMAVCTNCGKEFPKYASTTGKYCSNKCQLEYQHKEAYKKVLEGDESIMRANYTPKAFRQDIIDEQNGICAICGMKPEWNNKPLVFIIDHIDGNAANNKRDNLRCICPNCDSQLDTYKSKNKNGARSYYRYHKYDEETKIGR